MPNDLRIVQDLLARRAIKHKTSGDEQGTSIEIEVSGDGDFYVMFEFDKFDKLTKIGAWE